MNNVAGSSSRARPRSSHFAQETSPLFCVISVQGSMRRPVTVWVLIPIYHSHLPGAQGVIPSVASRRMSAAAVTS